MEGKTSSHVLLGLSTAVLLVVALELGAHADALSIWSDEAWSIFHGGKTVLQILRERDLLWPFGYFLVLHGWMRITGTTNDFVLHTLGVYVGLLAAAFLIRIGRVLRLPSAGLLAALAFGTSSYALYFLLELRGYGQMPWQSTASGRCGPNTPPFGIQNPSTEMRLRDNGLVGSVGRPNSYGITQAHSCG